MVDSSVTMTERRKSDRTKSNDMRIQSRLRAKGQALVRSFAVVEAKVVGQTGIEFYA